MRQPLTPPEAVPDLTSLILHEYRNELATTPEVVTPEFMRGVEAFAKFYNDYLDVNRPVSLSHAVDMNYQIHLKNQKTALIAPGVPSGTLPPSNAISCNRN